MSLSPLGLLLNMYPVHYSVMFPENLWKEPCFVLDTLQLTNGDDRKRHWLIISPSPRCIPSGDKRTWDKGQWSGAGPVLTVVSFLVYSAMQSKIIIAQPWEGDTAPPSYLVNMTQLWSKCSLQQLNIKPKICQCVSGND